MPNPDHLAKLISGVTSWNRWRDSYPLKAVNLRGANLSGANLLRADLSLADLSGANLTGTDLEGANLSAANLSAANLMEANLHLANLSEADLSFATCGFTIWAKLHLLETHGLSTMIHAAQSTLGTDTLVSSEGLLPVEFLKGCGLADWEIENSKLCAPGLAGTEITEIQYRVYDLLARGPIQVSPVFISYSHDDKNFVDKLGNKLDEKGVRYWRDIKDATAGRLDKVIERGISLNPTLLVVLSERAVESDWVEFEVERAVQLSQNLKREVLCPIALDKAWLTSDRLSGNLRAQIKKYNVLDFSSYADDKVFANQFRKLIDGLDLHYRSQPGTPITP